jgi:lysophospholipase L1-like esterase
MRKYKHILLVAAFFCVTIGTWANGLGKGKVENPALSKFIEFYERGGLPSFFEKAIHGDSIKVAYLGGSITAQNGWRVYSLEWFKQRFPKATFTEINAAIGGTGSDFGVFRLRDQVLKFRPDFVFVEFAVNDGGAPAEKIIRSMEGIVRQVWQANPKADICFVYTIANNFLEAEQGGQLPNSALTMEKVADKYQIPTINFGFEVARQVKDNQLIFKGEGKDINAKKVFSGDGVHPNTETGHVIYHEVLQRSFEKMIPGKPVHAKKHTLHKPIAPDYFAHTQMVDITKAELSKNWEMLQVKDNPIFSGFGKYLQQIGKAGESGETLTVHFKGRAIGVYDIMGPDAGRVAVEIDGVVKDTISRFDQYCTYRRMNYFLIDHLENKDHKVVFRSLCEPFGKSAILTKKEDVAKNPDKYKENNWYVGKILIDGEIQ